jgi:alpha-beta hydrolase superfamily lysophospholipase
MAVAPVYAQNSLAPARVAPGQACALVTQANADASAGTANINHDGTPIAGITAPDISRGFAGIPRSAQPPLTASQRRILACTYRLAEANADLPYTLFVPMLIMHGAKDSIVPAATSRRAVAALQTVGSPHIYLEFPDKDHEFWIRRGAAQMEKVFLFFNLVSKRTTVPAIK